MTLLHWLGEDCHESFTSHFSRSDSLLHPSPVVFLFSHSFSCWPRSYLWVCPLCSELRMEAQMMHFSTQPLLFVEAFYAIFLFSSTMCWRCQSCLKGFQPHIRETLWCPQVYYAYQLLITIWTRGAFWLLHVKAQKKTARLKLNWNSTQMRDRRKVTVGFKMSRLYVNTYTLRLCYKFTKEVFLILI